VCLLVWGNNIWARGAFSWGNQAYWTGWGNFFGSKWG